MHFIQPTCQVFTACQRRWFRSPAGELKPSSTDFSWTRARWEYGTSISCHRPTRNAAQVPRIHILLNGCLQGSAGTVFCRTGTLRGGWLVACHLAVVSADKTRRQDVDNTAHVLIVPWLLVGKRRQAPPNSSFQRAVALCLPATAFSYAQLRYGPCWPCRLREVSKECRLGLGAMGGTGSAQF